jgi:hypothetical protein
VSILQNFSNACLKSPAAKRARPGRGSAGHCRRVPKVHAAHATNVAAPGDGRTPAQAVATIKALKQALWQNHGWQNYEEKVFPLSGVE